MERETEILKNKGSEYFGDVTFTWFWNFSMSQIKKNTDVLVWEVTERYIDRLSLDRTKK